MPKLFSDIADDADDKVINPVIINIKIESNNTESTFKSLIEIICIDPRYLRIGIILTL